ncbi:regulatory sensor-transducer, BlaR1/MecR1 family [Bacillus sp. JCM 19046]|nr:regulatory sensor-transducer, BlaR1/MecR1 family [Bacillus sp. JCM 19045]GAF17383.1 regulatory sensor-transducer, BlaR1/MecR1 family [Bacillus sp. JCM 19046]
MNRSDKELENQFRALEKNSVLTETEKAEIYQQLTKKLAEREEGLRSSANHLVTTKYEKDTSELKRKREPHFLSLTAALFILMLVAVPFLLNRENGDQTQGGERGEEFAFHYVSEDLYERKNAYVGDNSAVGLIMGELPIPEGQQTDGMRLYTTEEPYGVTIRYSTYTNSPLNQLQVFQGEREQLVLYNATVMFMLIQNVDWIEFDFIDGPVEITREEVEDVYEMDVRNFSSMAEMEQAFFAEEPNAEVAR